MRARSLYSRPVRFFSSSSLVPVHRLNGIFQGVELVVMDIDGTVLQNTVPHYWKHMNETRVYHTEKSPWTEQDCDQYFYMIDEQHGASWISREHVMAAMLEVDDEGHEVVRVGIQTFYESFARDQRVPTMFPSFERLLLGLKDLGMPVWAFSDTDHFLINHMLTEHNVVDYFHRVIGDTRKPNPKALLEVLEQHPELPQTTGDHILVVGDNLDTDGALANEVGAKFIHFAPGLNALQRRARAEVIKEKQKERLLPNQTIMLTDFGYLCAELHSFAAEQQSKLQF